MNMKTQNHNRFYQTEKIQRPIESPDKDELEYQ